VKVVVHGDFYVRHIMVDDRCKVTGVIDWGDLHMGDPAIDLGVLFAFLPIEAHAEFLQTYGEVSEGTWHLARLRAIYHSSIFALYGHDTKNADVLEEAIWALNGNIRGKCYAA